MKILLGITGSVAAKLTHKMQQTLRDGGHEVKTIYTNSAYHFTERTIYDGYGDDEEWEYYHDYNSVLHIDLTQWADVLLIAPCTANTLAKIYNGICDNLLTSAVRAWDYKKKFIIAPSMNTFMYNNPPTIDQITKMKNHGVVFIDPITKELFCGDTGIGAMANIDDIIKEI